MASTQAIVSWTTPMQAAERALNRAAECLEFDRPAEAHMHLKEHLHHLRLLVAHLQRGYRVRGALHYGMDERSRSMSEMLGALKSVDVRLPSGDPARVAEFDRALGGQCPDCEFFGGSHDVECPRAR